MKLFYYSVLVILLIFFIPIPIKFSIYYSTVDYYVKLYKLTLISKNKKRSVDKKPKETEPLVKSKSKIFSDLYKNIDFKSLILNLRDLKHKPLLRINLSFDYSLNDAARTAISYGLIYDIVPLTYTILNYPFNINKFDFKINPIFEDKFLLKIETSSIIFLSLANAIYIIINLLKNIKNKGGDPLI
jgi:hypothetical protein